jgi:hypothetical protein
MTYLPFVEDAYQMYGLTTFCSPSGGITGFKAHFRDIESAKELLLYSVGLCQGCLTHFRMRNKERISGIWIRRPEFRVIDSYLPVFSTNHPKAHDVTVSAIGGNGLTPKLQIRSLSSIPNK